MGSVSFGTYLGIAVGLFFAFKLIKQNPFAAKAGLKNSVESEPETPDKTDPIKDRVAFVVSNIGEIARPQTTSTDGHGNEVRTFVLANRLRIRETISGQSQFRSWVVESLKVGETVFKSSWAVKGVYNQDARRGEEWQGTYEEKKIDLFLDGTWVPFLLSHEASVQRAVKQKLMTQRMESEAAKAAQEMKESRERKTRESEAAEKMRKIREDS